MNRVRRAAGAAKAGHGGTLDPLATGVLPVAFGEATKTVGYVVDGQKLYRFTVKWGEQRDTDDAEGEVIAVSSVRPTAADIRGVLDRFTGEIEQVPPTYSAIKISGRRAYALARVRAFHRPCRPGRCASIASRCVDVRTPTSPCSKCRPARAYTCARWPATWVRHSALSVMSRRCDGSMVGPFSEEQAISLENVEHLAHSEQLVDHLLPVGVALAGIPALTLTEAEARRLQHGRPIAVLPVACRSPLTDLTKDAVVCAMARGRPVALARIKGGEIRPVRILNL